MKIGMKTAALILLTSLWSGLAYAEMIAYQLSANVYSLYDPENVLQGRIQINDTLSGTYTFDSTVPNSSGYTQYGFYDHTHSLSPGYHLQINQEQIRSDPTVPGFMHTMHVANDIGDSIHIGSWGNTRFSNGAIINDINMNLYDDRGTALNGIVLGVTPPDINGFTYRDIFLSGTDSDGLRYFSVLATVIDLSAGVAALDPNLQKFQLDGRVMNVYDPANALAGAILVGAAVSGTYTVNITVPDQELQPEFGRYFHPPGLSEFGFDLNISDQQFQLDPQFSELWVDLYEGSTWGGGDNYSVFNHGSGRLLQYGAQVTDIGFYIYDGNGTLLRSDVLRDNPPVIPSNGRADMFISGKHANGMDYFQIQVTLQDISAWNPGAGTLMTLSPAAGSFDRIQRFDAAVIFGAGIQPLYPLTMIVNGMQDPGGGLNCFPGAATQRETWICPDITWRLFDGVNHVGFRANLIDGRTMTQTVKWTILY